MFEAALIHGWALDGSGGGEPLSAADAQTLVKSRDRPVWLHLDRSVPGLSDWLEGHAKLPSGVVDALLAEDTRPRCEAWNHGILLNLRGVNLNEGAAPEDMLAVRLWASPDLVISLRRHPLMAVRSLDQRLKEGHGPRSISDFLAMLAEGLTDRMGPVLSAMDLVLADMEEAVEIEQGEISVEDLTALRSRAGILRRFLAPQQAAVSRLAVVPEPMIQEAERISLRQTVDDVTRFVEDLDSLRERSAIVKDAMGQKQTARASRTMYLLTVVAGVFLPLSFVTGLLGINVGGMPGVDDGKAFWIVCGLLIALAVAEWIFLKRRRWV